MPKLRCQVVRDGRSRWMIWTLSDGFAVSDGEGREYEQVARVVEDDGLYYVELPEWGVDGITGWQRQPRGWALKEGAVKSVTNPKEKVAASA